MCSSAPQSFFIAMPVAMAVSLAFLLPVSSNAETMTTTMTPSITTTMKTTLNPSPNASPAPAKTASATKAKKSTTDELTKKALKRAQIHELEREQQIEVSTTNEEVGPIIIKPMVKSEPAPGLVKPAAMTKQKTSQEEARDSIMSSHIGEATSESSHDASHDASQDASHARTESSDETNPPATRETAPESTVATATAPISAMPSTPAKVQSASVFQASSSVSAEQSLKWLSNGNTRFSKKHFRADGRSEKDRARIWNGGQKPHAIVLACSDSVVPPEVVFDQALGEIYVIRTLGEVTDSAALASLEYAVQFLGAHLLVVMGHTRCDAVQGIVQVKEGESAGSEALDLLLSQIRVHTKSYTTEKASHDLEVESTLNADGVARDLVKRSEIIRKRVEAGQLVIKSALYRGDSGKVSFY